MTRRAPPWWPEGEAWPPRDPRWHWRRRRARFIGRLALTVGVVWVLSVVGALTLALRFGHGPAGRSPGVATLVFVLMVVLFLAVLRRVGLPIGDLIAAAHRVAEGDFSVRVPEHGPRPVRAVAAAFNDMAGRLARQEQQRRELMADIAHELRTPLSIVQGRLEGLIDGVYPRDTAQLEPLLDQTRVLTRLVEDLRTLANAESGVLTLAREPTDIGMLMHDAASDVAAEAAERGISLKIEDTPAMPAVNVDPVRMRQVLVNVLVNAVRHSARTPFETRREALRTRPAPRDPPGPTVSADARIADGRLVVRVADTGPGIPPEDLPRIFDRFYKGRGSSGSGLGLTIARSLVQAHGGEIHAESRLGTGTTVTFTVPAPLGG